MYSFAIDEATADGVLEVVDVADEVEGKAKLLVAAELEADGVVVREVDDDDEDEAAELDLLVELDMTEVARFEIEVAREAEEAYEFDEEVDDERLDVLDIDEDDDFEDRVVIDDEADEAKDEGGDGTDDDTDGARPEPTAQMLNLQLPPQT
jgi:hypothetical protein